MSMPSEARRVIRVLPNLHQKMRALAASDHARAAELVSLADEFEQNVKGFYSEPRTCDLKKFLGSWARARRFWSECSGEPLI